jgi:hypothetical protein
MDNVLRFNAVEEKIVTLRGVKVILDSDVAVLYGVGTKEVNQAVRNNPDKFPEGYIVETTNEEMKQLRSKFLTTNMSRVNSKAFTEKGLYMLATILKSEKATQTTIAIVETFAKIRELSRAVSELSETKDAGKQKSLMRRPAHQRYRNDIGTRLCRAEIETYGQAERKVRRNPLFPANADLQPDEIFKE